MKFWSLLIVVAVAASLLGPAPAGATPAAPAAPVPSLTPAATATLWRAEVSRRRAHVQSLSDDAPCRAARVIFYDQTDWLRVATKLAQTQSPCAEYFISVPPLAADHTQPRSGQAGLIRALGPELPRPRRGQLHRLEPLGRGRARLLVRCRSRSAAANGAAGFDTSAGDSWALNELSSAVRRGTGAARRNALDFLHGLASDGVKGVVFTAGVSQSSPDLTQYKVALQDWLQDTGFWTEVAAYTSDWAQENYGDLRDYAVAGTTAEQRRDAIAQYLTHEPALANSGPEHRRRRAGSARPDLRPLRQRGLGMALGLRLDSRSGRTDGGLRLRPDRRRPHLRRRERRRHRPNRLRLVTTKLGWSDARRFHRTDGRDPRPHRDRDPRFRHPRPDPGSAACAPDWCTTTLDGAAFTGTWQAFTAWSPVLPAFLTAPITATAGTAAGPLTVQLQTLGVPDNAVGSDDRDPLVDVAHRRHSRPTPPARIHRRSP